MCSFNNIIKVMWDKMTENEIIHIMSAGANIHNTFPVALKKIANATKVYVIVENSVYNDAIDEKKRDELESIIKQHPESDEGNNAQKELERSIKRQEMLVGIRDSIKTLKEIGERFVENGIHEIKIADDSIESTRDEVLKIYSDNSDAKFFLNLSGGTKMLSIGLFMMGLWIDAVPYVVDLNSQPRKLSVPKIHIKDLTENPNRVSILKKLHEKKPAGMTRKDLFVQAAKDYEIVRENGKEKRDLKQGTFNSLIGSLLEWELISEEFKKGSKKEKVYHITPDGEFTVKFIGDSNIV